MAEMNLLQGSLKGKLGNITGQVWKGKPVVKAAIFSKAPPTNAQTRCVRAFECLNRIASTIAAMGWPFLGLSDKKFHKHNAVASWLKPAVRNHIFEPANLVDVIPFSDNVRLSGFTLNKSSGETFLNFTLSNNFVPVPGSKLFALVFDDLGHVLFSHIDDVKNFSSRLFLHSSDELVLSVMAFISEPSRRGYNKYNFIFKRGQGMRYSLEQQLTGDLWIDGRPIYMRSYEFTLTPNAAANNVGRSLELSRNARLIKHEFQLQALNTSYSHFTNSVLQQGTVSSERTVTSVAVTSSVNSDTMNFNLSVSNGGTLSEFTNSACFLTVYYTLSSDPPVVDG